MPWLTQFTTRSSDRSRWQRREAAAEAALIFVAILLDIWWLRFHLAAAWAPILAVIVLSHVARGETPRWIGFRLDNLAAAWRRIGVFLFATAGALFAAGLLAGTIRDVRTDSAVGDLILYCFWGLLQEYVLNGFFVNRLAEARQAPSAHAVALEAAVLFATAHVPNWFLMLVTLAGGYLAARVYQRDRNLFVLGLAHGVIGILIYLVVPDSISRHLYVGPRWFSFSFGSARRR